MNDNSIKEVSFNNLHLSNTYNCKFWKCYAGIESLDIDVNGDIYACISLNKKIGNIYDNAYHI